MAEIDPARQGVDWDDGYEDDVGFQSLSWSLICLMCFSSDRESAEKSTSKTFVKLKATILSHGQFVSGSVIRVTDCQDLMGLGAEHTCQRTHRITNGQRLHQETSLLMAQGCRLA